jgi:hypothetical protein
MSTVGRLGYGLGMHTDKGNVLYRAQPKLTR